MYGNATGLTHIQYTNIDNKPTNFPAGYNSTVINTPNLSVYATTTDLYNLSSQSYLDIPNFKTTSTYCRHGVQGGTEWWLLNPWLDQRGHRTTPGPVHRSQRVTLWFRHQ